MSAPYGIASETEPNISSTRWRTVVDHQNLNYFFESAFNPNTFWVDLKKINFDLGPDKALKLDLGHQQSKVYAGHSVRFFYGEALADPHASATTLNDYFSERGIRLMAAT